jgi:hypothetical protein
MGFPFHRSRYWTKHRRSWLQKSLQIDQRHKADLKALDRAMLEKALNSILPPGVAARFVVD